MRAATTLNCGGAGGGDGGGVRRRRGLFFARTGLTYVGNMEIDITGVAVILISCRTDIVAIRTAAPAVETFNLSRAIALRHITLSAELRQLHIRCCFCAKSLIPLPQ